MLNEQCCSAARTIVLKVALLIFGLAPATSAQYHAVHIAFDTDNNAATGCSVAFSDASSPGGTLVFEGAEFTAEVDIDPAQLPPLALNQVLTPCGSPTSTALPSQPEIAGDLGHLGSDSVLIEIPMNLLGTAGLSRLGVNAISKAGADDVLLESNGNPVLFDLSMAAVPALGTSGVAILVVLLLLLGRLHSRSRTRSSAGLCVLAFLVAVAGSVGLARGTATWIELFDTVSPLAIDAEGDSQAADPAADLLAVLATRSENRLFLRIDLAELWPDCHVEETNTDHRNGAQWCTGLQRYQCSNGAVTSQACTNGCSVVGDSAYCSCRQSLAVYGAGTFWCDDYDRYYCPKVADSGDPNSNDPQPTATSCPAGTVCNSDVPGIPDQSTSAAGNELCTADCYFQATGSHYSNGDQWCTTTDRYQCSDGAISAQACVNGCSLLDDVAYCSCRQGLAVYGAGTFWCDDYDRYYCPKVADRADPNSANPNVLATVCPTGTSCNADLPGVPHQTASPTGNDICTTDCYFQATGSYYSNGDQWCTTTGRYQCTDGAISAQACVNGCSLLDDVAYCSCRQGLAVYGAGTFWCDGYDRHYCPKVADRADPNSANPNVLATACPTGTSCNADLPGVPHQTASPTGNDICTTDCYFLATGSSYSNGDQWCTTTDRYQCSDGAITSEACPSGCQIESGFAICL